MTKQTLFIIILLFTLLIFIYSLRKLYRRFSITQKTNSFSNWGERIKIILQVGLGQSKILRKPFIGLIHALVFWGFIVITIGSLEIIIDGLLGKDHSLSNLGKINIFISASIDIFAYSVLLFIIIFLLRRFFLKLKRFEGAELFAKNKLDALFSLSLIALLMISLIGINLLHFSLHGDVNNVSCPISKIFHKTFSSVNELSTSYYEIAWWTHILLIFFFANYLPYSKHFHVFLSLPNVLLSNLEPLTKIHNMPDVTNEVKLMMDINSNQSQEENEVNRFGVKDVEDITWKNYLDALTCTECGRCTEVCPANITGKKLSPRKIFVDIRKRMKEKGEPYFKNNNFDDKKALIHNEYISHEELWACTTCNACALECPLNISHPNLIVDMRRYLVMEDGSAPQGVNRMFANIENNGSPWQYSPDDRLNWTNLK